MINNFFHFWIKNLRTSFLFLALIIVVGTFSLFSIPKESSPDIKFGIISISTIYSWVNPEDMDSLITEKIEDEIENIEWIKTIKSSSSIWISSITVELETGVDTRNLLTDIKDKIDNLSLPEDAKDPNIFEISSNSTLLYEALIYWKISDFSNFELMQKAKKIKEKLSGVSGIDEIDVWGIDNIKWWTSNWSSDYEIKVLLSKSKVELLGLSIFQISNTIKANNKDTPIWNYKVWNLSYDFRFEWELSSIEDLKNIIIRDDKTSQIKLSDIAEFKIEYPWDEIKRLWINNETYNYTSLIFNKEKWTSVFKASENSKKALKNLLENNREFEWLHVEYSKDMSETIKEDYSSLWRTAITTLILVFFTILFFVGFREWIIASLLLPLAFLITFIVLDMVGLSMNFLTNFSLVLTLWIAIDTVIVIVEWASEKMRLWYSRKSSIILAIRDFKSPLISWTSTTLVAFLPLMFLPWVMWKFLSYIPITVFVTLVAALFLSLTLASALFITIMKRKKTYHKDERLEISMSVSDIELLKKDRENKTGQTQGIAPTKFNISNLRESFLIKLWNFYSNFLTKILSSTISKISFVVVPFILLILTFLFLSPQIWFTVMPQKDEWVINLTIVWEVGAKESSMLKYIPKIDKILLNTPEINIYYTKINGNKISIYLDLTKSKIREELNQLHVFDVEKELEKKLSFLKSEWLELTVASLKWWPPWGSAVWIKLIVNSAKNFEELKKVADMFEEKFGSIKWTKNVFSSSSDAPGQFVFEFNKDKLSNIGLNQWDILNELYFYTNWITSWSIKSEREDNDIIVSFKEFEDNLNPEDVLNLIINTKVWKVRVWDFATFEFKKSVNNISREDWNIIIEVWAELQQWYLPTDIQPLVEKFASEYNYPSWISYLNWWEWEKNKELIVSTIKSLFIAIFLIFSILVFQFNSFRQPAIVLYSIFLALLWVNIWLYLTGNPYSMPFMIWFIALTWIVVNDAIILIDRINKGIIIAESPHLISPKGRGIAQINYLELLVIAWKTRLQPIIVTTLTTVFWVLPLALQDEFWAGLWYTIIFWLFVWSFMTLIVIPVLYYYLVLKKKIKAQKK